MSAKLKEKKIFVAGHNGLAGSAIVRRLNKEDCTVLTANKKNLNLLNTNQVDDFFLI